MVFTGVSVVDTWLPVCGVSFLRLALHIKALPHTWFCIHTIVGVRKDTGPHGSAHGLLKKLRPVHTSPIMRI